MNSGKEPFDGDDLVTETYRELDVEKAPEHLNQSVLRMASGGGLPSPARNILFGAWMRPVAWAATIGLSLAIVLEYSEVPTAPVRSDNVPTAESMREDELGRSAAAYDDVEVFSREPKGKLDAVAAPSQPPLAAKTEIPEAKKQATELPADSQRKASYALTVEHSDVDDLCTATARLSQESWLTCIDKLRSSGREEAADREYEAFILKYPVESSNLEDNK